MFKSAILLAIFLNCATAVYAQTNDQICTSLGVTPKKLTTVGLQPLLLFTEYSAWSMAIGSESPTFAAYVDGTVIYWQRNGATGKYVSTHLTSTELQHLIEAINTSKLAQLKPCYSIVDFTDAPTNVLAFNTPTGYRTVSIYGPIRADNNQLAYMDALPLSLQTTLKTLAGFSAADAAPWQPPLFEVLIWPFSYAKEKSAVWPAKWPGLTDRRTVKHKSSYSLYLPISELSAYKAFARKIAPKQAVLIDSQKWTMSARFPFPHELPQEAVR